MFLCYDESKKFTGHFDPSKYWANDQVEKHLENYFFLKFILEKSANTLEKMQASKELVICERKIAYWQRQDNYSEEIYQKHLKMWKKNYERETA
tara:strand:- start:294 stop:575 length:282 start_codon:yes stop_codon:yes gene_type:complete